MQQVTESQSDPCHAEPEEHCYLCQLYRTSAWVDQQYHAQHNKGEGHSVNALFD